MQILENMDKCYGCGACENACPVGAISMVYNREGFREPVVDDDKCIKCDKCKKVCIANKDAVYANDSEPVAYAFSSVPSEIKESSSGAAFPAIAKHILALDGVVFGAVFNEKIEVVHKKAESEYEFIPMRMSKYAQSYQGLCYKEAKEALDAGRKVLYSGCACQIAGLKSYLGKEYDNLYTIDLICYGVPAPGLLKEHLDNTFGKDKVESLRMRKKLGWGTCFAVTLKNGKKVLLNKKKEIYMIAFLKGAFLRRTCYGCRYSRLPRQGDFTMGDFWNKKKLGIKLDDSFNKKCTIMYLNNDKAKQLFKEVLAKDNGNLFAKELSEFGFTAAQLNNNIGSAASSNTKTRERFYEEYYKKGFEKAAYEAVYPDPKERRKNKREHKLHFLKKKYFK